MRTLKKFVTQVFLRSRDCPFLAILSGTLVTHEMEVSQESEAFTCIIYLE
jgi:hypothetical protein